MKILRNPNKLWDKGKWNGPEIYNICGLDVQTSDK